MPLPCRPSSPGARQDGLLGPERGIRNRGGWGLEIPERNFSLSETWGDPIRWVPAITFQAATFPSPEPSASRGIPPSDFHFVWVIIRPPKCGTPPRCEALSVALSIPSGEK